MNLKNKRVTVMGIGLHGGSKNMIKWLLEQGAEVVATDIKKEEAFKKTLKDLKSFKNLKVIAGHHRPEDFKKVDLIIKNPTVPWNNKYIKIALKNKIPIEMDSSIFMEHCKSSKIIGVTGTKGKTTTASLIAEIIGDSGERVSKVGIGQEAVMDKLEKITSKTFVVFEMSSWRLSNFKKSCKSPRYALITNIHPDHLNHYDSMDDYIEDKKQVFLHQKPEDFLILNYDDKVVRSMAKEASSKIVYFSNEEISWDRAVFIRSGKIITRFNQQEKEICDIRNFNLKGAHNLYNILGAIAVVSVLGINLKKIKKTLTNFKGVVHRLEFIRNLKGIDFYNDTTATTPEAGIVGVESFMRPLNLIIGGASKKLDSTIFLKKIANSNYVKNIFVLDSPIAEKIEEQLIQMGGEKKVKGIFKEFEKAIKSAYSEAQRGEVVLLSPGFASFGMFENEFDRGRQFREIVRRL